MTAPGGDVVEGLEEHVWQLCSVYATRNSGLDSDYLRQFEATLLQKIEAPTVLRVSLCKVGAAGVFSAFWRHAGGILAAVWGCANALPV